MTPRSAGLGQRIHAAAPWLFSALDAGRRAGVGSVAAIQSVAFGLRQHRRASGEPPLVVLDGCAFQLPHSGIARLWDAIMAEWTASGFARQVLVLDRAGTAPRHEGFGYLRVPELRVHDWSAQAWMLGRICRQSGARAFISTNYTRASGCRSALYLYDMTPEVLGWDLNRPEWREKRHAIESADALICLSQSTADDLETTFPAQATTRPVSIALPGLDSSFEPADAEEVARLVDRLGLPQTYYVFIGHREGYKNADLVFRAIEGMQADSPFGLLLLGGQPSLEPGFARLAGDVPVTIARLPDDELRAAYSGAAALLYVSRYEGFGLPIIEAMACGCPVITCRNSSLPEAAGDAALFVDESDASQLRDAMRRVREPAIRVDLLERGLEWSAGFDWAKTAEQIERVLEAVSARPEGPQ